MRIHLLALPALLACQDTGVTVHNTAPDVTISAPTAGQIFASEEGILLNATVGDAETPTDELDLIWSTDADGELDLEIAVDRYEVSAVLEDGLPAGAYSFTLLAIDPSGESGADTVDVVISDNAPPSIHFTTPNEGAECVIGELLTVQIAATDADDDVTALALTWGGEAAGAADAPTNPDSSGLASFYLTPEAVGPFELSVTAQDPAGGTDSATTWCEAVELDSDGDGYTAVEQGGDDCDDDEASVHPDADEICNGIDDDCDGDVDEAGASDAGEWFADLDGDGYGDPASSEIACEAPSGYLSDDSDCDDARADVNPAATEVCDGIDNDCDGETDEPDASDAATWYLDVDGDGYGLDDYTTVACDEPAGYAALSGDCDDTDTAYNPGASESDCSDPNDYNCDGVTGYADDDGDGYAACEECDDTNADHNPGAIEYCDGDDDDCDGTVDEDGAIDASTWYADADSDTYGDAGSGDVACDQPAGFVADDTDCDDATADANPAATEVCDAIDNDCDGDVDEDSAADAPTWYGDGDSDGFGDAADADVSCEAPAGYVASDADCDDGDADINPDAEDTCDGIDNDCSGSADDGGDCPCDVEDYDGAAYMFCLDAATWSDAYDECETWGYHLLTVDDTSENDWASATAYGYSATDSWWMGFNDIVVEGSFGWADGSSSSYTNWAKDEPNDLYGAEDCAELNWFSDTTWNDADCGLERPYVCEAG